MEGHKHTNVLRTYGKVWDCEYMYYRVMSLLQISSVIAELQLASSPSNFAQFSDKKIYVLELGPWLTKAFFMEVIEFPQRANYIIC